MFSKRFLKVGAFFSLLSCLVLGTVLFMGCPTDSNDTEIAEFSGTWTSIYGDNFIIDTTANTFTYWYGTGNPNYGTDSMDYKGDIVGAVLADKTLLQSKYGYLTIKITNAGSWGPTTGKFYVIHWKDLTTTSVQEAGAYKQGGQNSGMDTLEAAVAEYTVDNGYFGGFGGYTKQ